MKPRPSPTLKQILIGQPEPLTVDDLAKLHEGGRTTSSIQRLRASHHKMARLAAYGFTNKEIAAHTGYTKERVGQLLGAPAMKELIAIYAEKIEERETEKFDAVQELLLNNTTAMLRHVSDHIAEADESGELIPLAKAAQIASDGMDRLGFGKRSTVTNLNVDMALQLERAIKRSGKAPPTIEGTVAKVSKTPPLAQPALSSPRPLISRRA